MSLTASIFGTGDKRKPSNVDNDSTTTFFDRSQPIVTKIHEPIRKRVKISTPTMSKEDIIERRKRLSKEMESFTVKPNDPIEDFRSTLQHTGVVVLRDIVPDLDSLRQQAAHEREKACQALRDRGLSWNEEVNNKTTIRFRELCVRCKGRMDVRYPGSGFWEQHERLNAMIRQVLGDVEPAVLVYAGWIFSFPGSVDQPWHQDGRPLFATGCEHLPCYALNVFVPLDVDVEQGPTEFVLGSHRMSEEDAMTLLDEEKDLCAPILQVGDALCYDYRTCHRGTANLSSKTRSVLYLMFARPWYKEHVNFGDEPLC